MLRPLFFERADEHTAAYTFQRSVRHGLTGLRHGRRIEIEKGTKALTRARQEEARTKSSCLYRRRVRSREARVPRRDSILKKRRL